MKNENVASEETVGTASVESQPELSGLSIGGALHHMANGLAVYRESWEGDGIFVFKQARSRVPKDIVPKMSSLPDGVKEILVERGTDLLYDNQLSIVYSSSQSGTTHIYGWEPSPSDLVATDWKVYTGE